MTKIVDRAKTEFERHAKEVLSVEEIGGTLYAFGSELACLRLLNAYRDCGDAVKAAYSENQNSWFFRLERSTL
jgi:hypothetical protein